MKKYFSPVLLLMAVVISSCNNSSERGQGMLPNVSGSSGEVVVVISNDKWDGELGDKIREVLGAQIDGLPQSEPEFDLVNVTGAGFGDLYITHRNVVMVETAPDKTKEVKISNSVYSKTQLIIHLQGKNDQDIISLLDEKGSTIVDKINITERDRWISYYKRSINTPNFNILRNTHKMTLYTPSNYSLDVNENGFAWFSYETPTTTQSVLINYFDYNGENYFNEDSIKAIQNRMTKSKVKGHIDGTWMAIEDKMPLTYSSFRFRDRDYYELKGLWTLENGFMGGPFVTLVTLDKVNNRFVMIEGFVYAPQDKKRELLRQVEAILYTVNFDIDTDSK